MHVLIVKNVSGEGPGTIEDHLCRERISYSVIDLSIGDSVPQIDIFTHLLIMGGPMAVYEMHHFPCLVSEAELIHAARVSQWHGDTFDLPEGSVRLSSFFREMNIKRSKRSSSLHSRFFSIEQ